MKKRTSPKSIDVNTILAIICILIFLTVVFYPPMKCRDLYKMELYIKTPENNDIKIRECGSLSSDLNCGTPYANYFCTSKGTYYGKAVTYLNNKILSASGWSALPDLCK